MSAREFHFKGKVYAVVPDVGGAVVCEGCAFYSGACMVAHVFSMAEREQGLSCADDGHHYVEKESDDEV